MNGVCTKTRQSRTPAAEIRPNVSKRPRSATVAPGGAQVLVLRSDWTSDTDSAPPADGQDARGPLRPTDLHRGRERSRADPRPAGVRVSLQKQRPKRGERLLAILCAPLSDLSPYLNFLRAAHRSGCAPHRAPPADCPAPAPPGLRASLPRPPRLRQANQSCLFVSGTPPKQPPK